MVSVSMKDGEYSSEQFEEKYTYEGTDLGCQWQQDASMFRLWAPLAQECSVVLYKEGDKESSEILFQVPMKREEKGTWTATVPGDIEGVYYTYRVKYNEQVTEACDPYAKAVGVNGDRAMVVNLDALNPEGWEEDENPNKHLSVTDAIIYEVHVRDFSIDESSGIISKGHFLGFTEEGTINAYGQSTGIDYLKKLGVTHVHLLPAFDYGSIDETGKRGGYNWGYDPKNYNVPEGSYSTDPYDGRVRIREMKEMVQALHKNGISVIMDVVYNHVYEVDKFCFNRIVPDYFSRRDAQGNYSNGSYCGNDTATERSMVHRYIVQSILYWMKEYHIDGFRFDLVGLMDTDVINDLVAKVHAVRPDVIFYGEGWDMPTKLTKTGYKMAIQMNSQSTPQFAYFNDSIRDLIKGKHSNLLERGYVNGAKGQTDALKADIMGLPYWSPTPSQTVQYTSCHDDFGIFDRLQLAEKGASLETLSSYNRLAAAIIFLSQGIPFIHAGEEFLRSKHDEQGRLIANTYNSPDSVNSIKWNDLNKPVHAKVQSYYEGLIAFRKAHKALRLDTPEKVRNAFRFMGNLEGETIAYEIDTREISEEQAEKIVVILNPEKKTVEVALPEGSFRIYITKETAGTEVLATAEGVAEVPPVSAMVLVQ